MPSWRIGWYKLVPMLEWLNRHRWYVALVAVAAVVGFVAGAWYGPSIGLGRYEIIKTRMQTVEFVYRIDHGTGETWFLNPLHGWQRVKGRPVPAK